jgi:hypothetical protein
VKAMSSVSTGVVTYSCIPNSITGPLNVLPSYVTSLGV